MDKKNSGGMNIGTSSILVTFVLLCLVTFAALSYLSAQSDMRLSTQAAERTAAYYDANRMAEIYLANIDALLGKLASSCVDKDGYMNGIEGIFGDNDSVNVVRENEDIFLSYRIVVSKAQNLDVRLRVCYPDDNDGKVFYIDKWSTRTNSDYIEELKEKDIKENGTHLMF